MISTCLEWYGFLNEFNTSIKFAQHLADVTNNIEVNTLNFLEQFQSLIENNSIILTNITSDGFIFLADGSIVFTENSNK